MTKIERKIRVKRTLTIKGERNDLQSDFFVGISCGSWIAFCFLGGDFGQVLSAQASRSSRVSFSRWVSVGNFLSVVFMGLVVNLPMPTKKLHLHVLRSAYLFLFGSIVWHYIVFLQGQWIPSLMMSLVATLGTLIFVAYNHVRVMRRQVAINLSEGSLKGV